MKNVDYIIVGGGFAGLFFAHQLIKSNQSFVLISDRNFSASEVSGGVINPIVLNKFTSFWLGDQQLQFLKTTLEEVKSYLGKNYFENRPVHRVLHDDNEKQTWLSKSDNEELTNYLSKDFSFSNSIINHYGVGEVNQSGRLLVQSFFSDFYAYLQNHDAYLASTFDFDSFSPNENKYKDYHYQHIVFAEGIRVKQNPYFSYLPIIPSKGHHLSVELSHPITEKAIIKKKHFLFEMENGWYYSGGTFDRNSNDYSVMDNAVEELKKSIEEVYPHPYEVKEIEVGLRPTLQDRKPTLGAHPEHPNMYILNGMGSRGVLNGCFFAHELFLHIENKTPLLPEISIERFQA